MNATQFRKVKEHLIPLPQPNGKVQLKPFTFKPGMALKMPQEVALLFLDVAPSFRVRNTRGQIVKPRKFGKGEDRNVTLKPHEVAVSVTQVLKPVLYDMAKAMPGGAERFTKEAGIYSREELEEFVISGGKVDDDDEIANLDTTAAA